MKNIFLSRVWVFTLLFAFSLTTLRAAGNKFSDLLDRYYQDYAQLFPLEVLMSGDNDSRYENVWPDDIGPEHREKVVSMCTRYLDEIAQYDRATLAPSEQLSYDILKWKLTLLRESTQHFFHLMPVNQFYSPQLLFAQFGSGSYLHSFKTGEDYRNFISRAKGFTAWIDTAIANMREGMKKSVVQPRILMERVLPQLEAVMSDSADNLFLVPLKNLPPDLSADEKEKLAGEYSQAIRSLIFPAYAKLHVFIKDEYLPHCRDSAGIGSLPGGREAYAYTVRLQTTTDLTPNEIHEIGLREVARIRTEMAKVQLQVGFTGSLRDFLKHVATDAQFAPFETEEDVLNGYRAIESRVMAAVPRFFSRIPHTKFEIRATEKFRVATASAEYSAGTPDGSRPGIFYVPIVSAKGYRNTRMEDLFLHEAIPGHHFQISLTLENTTLPKFRRFDANNSYVEGWALYCESLGKELGMFSDPYQYFGMLLYDMHRAVRLVVDTGIHAKGWTREQALEFSEEQEGSSPTKQYETAEVERYMAWPGQALGYKIGQLKIRELRALAEKQLGAKFDIRAFHDEVLMEGALPLAVLEARIRDWISRESNR